VRYYTRHYQDIDLVILDMVMPRMNGHDTFLKMKEINPQVKAILSSGYSVDVEAQEVLKKGALQFVQKPFRRADLSRAVADILKRK
jgi:DNA-binding NtrC family response regulator